MRRPTEFRTPRVERSGHVTILTLAGAAPRDEENMLARDLKGVAAGARGGHLLLDFAGVRYVNSVELGTLVTLHKRMAAAGGRLTLFNMSAQVYEVFALTRLDSLLSICRQGPPPLPTPA